MERKVSGLESRDHFTAGAEIIIFQPDDQSVRFEVRIEDETVWLTQGQMAELFSSTKQNISLHINNIFKERELNPDSTVKEYLTVQKEGLRNIKRKVTIYNLDIIISVGYRVKSHRGTQFRIWAGKVLKDYLLKGFAINQRFDRIEKKLLDHDQKFDLLIQNNLPHNEGVFYEGQIFDAHQFVAGIVRSAERSIILIDNYIDETVLLIFSKRKQNVTATIYTRTISAALRLDIDKFNAQYPEIKVRTFNKSHDRFIIIDHRIVYHIGASLKDLGKKWFAFSKIGFDAEEMIRKLD